MKKSLFFFCLLLLSQSLFSQSGTPVASFGNNGIMVDSSAGSLAAFMVAQSDNKILVSRSGVLYRYNADGTRDLSFGSGFFGSSLGKFGIQSSGKIIVVVGQFGSPTIIRLNPNGTLDGSFGSNGIGSTSIERAERPHLMAVQEDDKIIVGGQYVKSATTGPGLQSEYLVRFTAEGALDPTFGNGGLVLGQSPSYYPVTLAIQPDRKILINGYNFKQTPSVLEVHRYNADGVREGTALITSNDVTNRSFSIAVQEDNKILIDGPATAYPIVSNGSSIGTGYYYPVVRYHDDGTPDVSFGNDGSVLTNFKRSDYSLVVQTDNKIIVAGFDTLARYLPNGTLDGSFGVGGKIALNNGVTGFRADRVTLTEDRIYLAGSYIDGPTSSFAIAAFNINPVTLDCTITGGLESICADKTTTWSGPVGMDSYQWNGPGGFSATTREISVSAAGTYTLISTRNGLQYTCSRALKVTPLPAAIITSTGVSPSSAGLQYKYYEGSWTRLPDFGGRTPAASGSTANITLALRKRDEQFAFLFEGSILIPKAGRYYFETASDDGSKLYIGGYGHFVTPVVDNDGQHGLQTKGGWYTFREAGRYDIAISYFEQGGDEQLHVYWGSEDAGIAMHTPIPDNAFGPPAKATSTLTYQYYEGSWDKLPDFGGLKPLETGHVTNIDLSRRKRDEQFAFLWQGKLTVAKAGWYYLETFSDDGSRLYIGNYGHYITPVVDNDGQHAALLRGGWYNFPAAGQYDIAVSFFEQGGGQQMKLFWGSSDAGIPMHTPIPDEAFAEQVTPCGTQTLTASEGDSYRWSTGDTTRSIQLSAPGTYGVTITTNGCQATSEPMLITCMDNSIKQKTGELNRSVAQAGALASGQLTVTALPNPSPSHFTLQVSSSQSSERITLRMLDGVGRLVETKIIAAGSQLQVGHKYRPGTYFAEVVQGSEKVTLKLVKTAGF